MGRRAGGEDYGGKRYVTSWYTRFLDIDTLCLSVNFFLAVLVCSHFFYSSCLIYRVLDSNDHIPSYANGMHKKGIIRVFNVI